MVGCFVGASDGKCKLFNPINVITVIMEKKDKVEFFWGNCAKSQGDVETFLCAIDSDHSFIGKRIAIKDDLQIIYYILPFSDDDAILFVVIEESGQLLDAYEGYSNADLDILESSFPKTIRAIRDGMSANLTNYAIVRLESNERPFDCVATKISNINIADLDTEYVFKKVLSLCEYANEVLKESDWDRVSFWQKARIMAHGVIEGAQTAIKAQRIGNFLDKIL